MQTNRRAWLIAGCFEVCLALLTVCEAAAETRIALVGTHSAGAAGGVMALAEAKLTSREGLAVLDRQQIERVLKEQKLAVGGLIDAAGAVKVGQLLTVDLFVVVEQSEDGKESLGCVIYDAGNGLRLRDAALVAKELEGLVEEVVSAVARAAALRAAGLNGLRTLSVVGVRNADLPQSLDGTCASLGMLLERELARGGDLALLERKRLSWLQQERGLAATAAEQELLASMVLVDVEFSRHANGVRAAINLTDSKGVALHRATAESKSLDVSLLAPLADAVRQHLHVAPASAPADRVRECRRFLREARLNWSFKLEELAVAAAESALLLDPHSRDARLLLAEYLFRRGGDTVSKIVHGRRFQKDEQRVYPASELTPLLPTLRRPIELLDEDSRRNEPRNATEWLASQDRSWQALAEAGNALQYFLHVEAVSGPDSDEWQNEWPGLLATHRQTRLRRLRAGFEIARRDGAAIPRYCGAVSEVLGGQYRYVHDPHARAEVAVAAVDDWLTLFDERPNDTSMLLAADVILGQVAAPGSASSYDPATIQPLNERLKRSPHSLLKLYGRQGELFRNKLDRSLTLTEKVTLFRPLRESVFALLDDPENLKRPALRSALYGFIRDAYMSFHSSSIHDADPVGSRVLTAEVVVACEAMLARREAHGYLLKELATGVRDMDSATGRNSHVTLVAAIKLLESEPPPVTFESSLKETHQQARLARDELERKWPELRAPTPDEPQCTITALQLGTASPPRTTSPRGASVLFNAIVGRPLVVGDHAYALRDDPQPRREPKTFAVLRLMRIPLDATAASELGTVSVKSDDLPKEQDVNSLWRNLVRATCAGGDKLYVAVAGRGVVAFDLKRPESQWLPALASFPTLDVQSLAWHDGTLYAGLAGGYLVKCDPTRETCEVLVSSRRPEKKSPLDDVEAFDVPMLGFDLPRQRLLFAISRGNFTQGSVELWEHLPRDKSFRRLFEAWALPATISPLHNERMLFTKNGWLLSYDAVADKPFVLASGSLGPALPATRQQAFTAPVRQAVHCQGRIWFGEWMSAEGRLGSARLEAGKPAFVPIKLPELSKSEPAAEWITTPVDDRRFLWSNRRHLWLVTPESPAKPARPAKEDAPSPSPTVPR